MVLRTISNDERRELRRAAGQAPRLTHEPIASKAPQTNRKVIAPNVQMPDF